MEFWLEFPVNLPRILEEFHSQFFSRKRDDVLKEFVGKRRWDWNRWIILIGIPNGFSPS